MKFHESFILGPDGSIGYSFRDMNQVAMLRQESAVADERLRRRSMVQAAPKKA